MDRTDSKIDTPVTRGRSGPVRYELIGADGGLHGTYISAQEAATFAKSFWPDQEQDRTGKGWDVQVVGAGR